MAFNLFHYQTGYKCHKASPLAASQPHMLSQMERNDSGNARRYTIRTVPTDLDHNLCGFGRRFGHLRAQ